MPSVSNIAVGAAMAGAAASKARHQMNESIARLSTGIRSMYGGDAAGQSIANSLGAKGASFAVAARNAEDGISFLQAAESLLLEVAALTTRLRELGIQYANKDLLTTTDEAALDAEAIAIGDAIDGIADNVKFNGTQLIGSVAGGGAITIGINDQGNTATIGTATTIAITNTDNITGANGVDGSADTALGQIAKSLGNVAAGMSALKGYQAVASASAANLKAAAARIQDTDYALETANLTKAAILNQSAMAMVAQANQAQQAILTVIQ
ncbi:MAG: flagellin [Alphaproteobacteria bacterium]